MFGGRFSHFRCSLRTKLLIAMIPLLVISLALAMAGLGTFLRNFFRYRAEQETAQLSIAVKSVLRQSMLQGSEFTVNSLLDDLQTTPTLKRIWVIDSNGRIAHAADRSVIGRVLNRNKDPRCTICHSERQIPQMQTQFARDESGASVVRHMDVIKNEKACWSCHGSSARLNGVLLCEVSTESYESAVSTIQRRLSVTGGLILALVVVVFILVTTKFIERPIRRLIAGTRQLGSGDLNVRLPVHGYDELAELAQSFNQMAIGLQGGLEEIRNKNGELSILYSILEPVTRTINLGELKQTILQALLDVIEADRVFLLSNLTPQQSPEILARCRGVEQLQPITTPHQHSPLLSGFPSELITRWSTGGFDEPFVTEDHRVAIIPIRIRDTQLGTLLVQRDRPLKSAEANPQLLKALSAHIGAAFENARLYTLAITDELTQLFSVRYFHSQLEESVSRYQRYGQKFAVLMLDVDFFKRINDEYGHPAGDEVLRRLSTRIVRNIRSVDRAYRYGGEEFAILLPEIDVYGAQVLAERLRSAIDGLEIPIRESLMLSVTVSIGIAFCPDNSTSAQDLVAKADAALYDAKQGGRNCVRTAMTANSTNSTLDTHGCAVASLNI